MPERWLTVPRASTPRRPVSSREVYHPSVQDLSEQAACYGNNYMGKFLAKRLFILCLIDIPISV